MAFDNLREMAAFFEGAAARAQAAMVTAAKETSLEMLAIARDTFGDSSKLEDLSPATQEERAELGYAPDEPLYRGHGQRDMGGDGTPLRDSVTGYAFEKPRGAVAGIISTDPRMFYHEFGYETVPFGNKSLAPVPVPPRPVFRETTIEILPFVEEKAREIVQAALDPEARK